MNENAERYEWIRAALLAAGRGDDAMLRELTNRPEPTTPEEFDAAIDAVRGK